MLPSRRLFLLLVACLTFLSLSSITAQDETPIPSPSPTETLIPTLSPTATATDLPSATLTETATSLPSETPNLPPTSTESLSPTEILTASPTIEMSDSPAPTITVDAANSPTASLTPSTTAPATSVFPTAQPLNLMFSDNFDIGDLSRWTLGPGWGLVANEGGQALQTTNDAPLMLNEPFGEGAAEARMQFVTGTVQVTLRQGQNGSYTAQLGADGQVKLLVTGQEVTRANVTANQPGQWRTLRLEAANGYLRIAVDGVEVLTALDATPLPIGILTIAGNNTENLFIDNVSVWLSHSEVQATATSTTTLEPFSSYTPTSVDQSPLTLLYSDDFDRALPVWTNISSNPPYLVPSAKGYSLQIGQFNPSVELTSYNLTDVTVQTSVLIYGGAGRLHVRQSNAGSYTISLSYDGQLELYRGNVVVQSVGMSFERIQWHTLRLSALGNIVHVQLDGTELITFIDNNPLPSGTIGFTSDGSQANTFLVDTFRLWGIGSATSNLIAPPVLQNQALQVHPNTFSIASMGVGTSSLAYEIWQTLSGFTHYDIFILDPANPSAGFQVTNDSFSNYGPALSPVGSKLAYLSDHNGNSYSEIYVLDGNTYQTQYVATGYAQVWSPDGSKLAYLDWYDNKIYTISSNGSYIQQIPTVTNINNYDLITDIAWTKGNKIAYTFSTSTGIQELHTVDVSNNSYVDQNISALPGYPALRTTSYSVDLGSWSSTGKLVFFAPITSSTGATVIYDDINKSFTVLNPSSMAQSSPRWSPDDTQIAFSYFPSANSVGISTMNANGTGSTTVKLASNLSNGIDWSSAFPPPPTIPTAIPTSTPTITRTPSAITLTPSLTYTPTPNDSDLIFSDTFESGTDLSWLSRFEGNGNLSVTTAAKLVGQYGLQAIINSNTSLYLEDFTPSYEPQYRARFYFDPNSIAMAENDRNYVFSAQSDATSSLILFMEFGFSNSHYQLRMSTIDDSNNYINTQWYNITDAPHYVEFNWKAATAQNANNGLLEFWIDGIQQGSITTVDNDTRRIDAAYIEGPIAGIDSGTRGTMYFDEFVSRRHNYIGPMSGGTPTPTFTPTPTDQVICPQNLAVQPLDANPNATATPITVCQAASPTPSLTPIPMSHGLSGYYYRSDQTLALNRTDDSVNFSWGNDSPDPSSFPVGDHFSVRWTGQLQAMQEGTYEFYTISDDGVRLWIYDNNQWKQIINNWTKHNEIVDASFISLNANQYYDIILDYYEDTDQATIKLGWVRPDGINEIIPNAQLFVTPEKGIGCQVQLDPYSTVLSFDSPLRGFTPTSSTMSLFNSFDLDGVIKRPELDRIRNAYYKDRENQGINDPQKYALGNHHPGTISDPEALIVSGIFPNRFIHILAHNSETNVIENEWVFSGYGVNTSNCPDLPTNTPIEPFTYDTDGVVDTTNLFTLVNNSGMVNSVYLPHPLDTSLDHSVLMEAYLKTSSGLKEYNQDLSQCASNDPTCPNRVYMRMFLQAQNRFNDLIWQAADDNHVPPLMLKLLLMEESGLVPALTHNTASASGIAQFVDWSGSTYGGAGELVRLGRGVTKPLPGGIIIPQKLDLPNAKWYRDLIDGLPGDSSYDSTAPVNCPQLRAFSTGSHFPVNETADCINFEETQRAIDDAAFLLAQNYSTLHDRIDTTISTYWNNLPLSPTQKTDIIWTWTLAKYNSGNYIYSAIPQLPSYGPISSANAVCSLYLNGIPVVGNQPNRYVGDIITGNPGSGTLWCNLNGR